MSALCALKKDQSNPAPTHLVWLLGHQCSLKKKKKRLYKHCDWLEVKKSGRFFSFPWSWVLWGCLPILELVLLREKASRVYNTQPQCLGPPFTSGWKCSVSCADLEDWVITAHHHPTREGYHSPLLLIELELRFNTAKSSDLFCLFESQSLSGLWFGKCKFCFPLNKW